MSEPGYFCPEMKKTKYIFSGFLEFDGNTAGLVMSEPGYFCSEMKKPAK
jgi:hypothetical protein